jgi:nucleoside 2-deoxyribosyltransferase
MGTGFVIMQIGNAGLEEIYNKIIAPAIKSAGLYPKRVDKHNRGGLLKSEIVHFILDADIIVADLTNERPNCYLEVGYAMGAARNAKLILTARADHKPDKAERAHNAPKVHFDLSGYDILYWEPEDLTAFREELETRIKRRLNVTLSESLSLTRENPLAAQENIFAENHYRWIREKQTFARKKVRELGYHSFVEFMLVPIRHILSLRPHDLLKAAKAVQLSGFGFPIGTVWNDPESRPSPEPDCIVSESKGSKNTDIFDFWALNTNGDFYSLRSLVEDLTDSPVVFVDETVRRVHMLVEYAARLYQRLDLPKNESIAIELRYVNIKDRILSAASPSRTFPNTYQVHKNSVRGHTVEEWNTMKANLPELVEVLAGSILEQFDFFDLSKEAVESILSG